MAKKNTLGKLIAFTAAVAAIGGTCYIYRDKIKESEIYKKSISKLQTLRNSLCKSNNEDEFIDDDDDTFSDGDFESIFSDDAKNSREYTSIAITPKTTTNVAMDDEPTEDAFEEIEETDKSDDSEITVEISEMTDSVEPQDVIVTEDIKELFASDNNKETEEVIESKTAETEETIETDNDISTSDNVDEMTEIFPEDSIPTISFSVPETPSVPEEPEVLGYENEGLSDVFEDPDVLEDQDKLDF